MLRTTSTLIVTLDATACTAKAAKPRPHGLGHFGLGTVVLLGLFGCDSKDRDFGEGTEKTQNADDAGEGTTKPSDTQTDETSDEPTETEDTTSTDADDEPTETNADDEPTSSETEDTDEPPPATSEVMSTEPDTSSEPAPTMDGGTEPEGAGGGGNEPTGAGGNAGTGEEVKGEAGMANLPADTSVHGRLIDFWNHPLPGVIVVIGEETSTTDEDGLFEFEEAPEKYDASFVASWGGSTSGSYAWRYEGLTRRDPTLQAFTGLPEHSSHVTITASNVTQEEGMELRVAFGSPDGATTHSIGQNGLEAYPYWRGLQANTSAYFHALLWQAVDDLPTNYWGYDSGLHALSESDESELDVDPYENSDLMTGTLEGSVTPKTGADRTNSMFVQFPDGARIQLVNDYEGPDEFSYIAPLLPEAAMVAVAAEGWSGDAMAFAYRGGITPGNDPIKLEIPSAPTLLTPTNGTTLVPAETNLRWQGEDTPVVIHIESTSTYDGFYIVTSSKEAAFGEFAAGAKTTVPGVTYTWEVQQHGRFESIDDLAGEEGFLNPFSLDYESPLGPRDGDGYFAVSARNGFVVAE